MPDSIDQLIDEAGSADVLVILKSPTLAAAKTSGKQMSQHFTKAETAPASYMALAAALHAGAGGRRAAVKQQPAVHVFPRLGVMLGTVNAEGAKALKKDKTNVEEVFPLPPLRPIRPVEVRAATARRKFTWGIAELKMPDLWDQGFDGSKIAVGHLDTGVDGAHPALKAALKKFAFFDNFGVRHDIAPKNAKDTDDHGTHTAATIAGRPFRSGTSNVHIGVAPGADLFSATVIEGGQVVLRVLGGMEWALEQNVRILSMSLGFPGFNNAFRSVTRRLRELGVLPVFAVGNEGPGTSRSPGNYAEALSVGAGDRGGNVADFSSSQRFARRADPVVPDLVGPGVDIISAKPGGGFQSMDGTSMATPHIAGLAAVLMQAVPKATADQVEAAIYASCTLRAGMPAEFANRGMPDAVKALAQLRTMVPAAAAAASRRKPAAKPK